MEGYNSSNPGYIRQSIGGIGRGVKVNIKKNEHGSVKVEDSTQDQYTEIEPVKKYKDWNDLMCCECGKIYPGKEPLKKHIRQTHRPKNHRCKICLKDFADGSKLRRHNLVHTGFQKHQCRICEKRFSLDFNLRTHMRIHTGEKPYLCEYPDCDRAFSQLSNKNCHYQQHFKSPGNVNKGGSKSKWNNKGTR